jgi:hypothetical protein
MLPKQQFDLIILKEFYQIDFRKIAWEAGRLYRNVAPSPLGKMLHASIS